MNWTAEVIEIQGPDRTQYNMRFINGTLIILQKLKINQVSQFIWDVSTEITPNQNPEQSTKLLLDCSPSMIYINITQNFNLNLCHCFKTYDELGLVYTHNFFSLVKFPKVYGRLPINCKLYDKSM